MYYNVHVSSHHHHILLFLLSLSKANATHTVILRPLSEGIYNLSFAVMTYQASEGGQEQVRAHMIANRPHSTCVHTTMSSLPLVVQCACAQCNSYMRQPLMLLLHSLLDAGCWYLLKRAAGFAEIRMSVPTISRQCSLLSVFQCF